jgi:putative FmdB family regulatory protein
MPIYSYQCDNCDYEFDIFQHFSDETLTEMSEMS